MKPFKAPITSFFVSIVTLLTLSAPLRAETPPTDREPASVKLPLTEYDRLVNASRLPVHEPRIAPSTFALGQSSAEVRIEESGKTPYAAVTARLSVKVLENEWTGIPVLPAGVSVSSATLDGAPVEFVPSAQGLLWTSNRAGSYNLEIQYRSDVKESGSGAAVNLPLPFASSTHLKATLPATALEPTVIPAQGVIVTPSDAHVMIEGTVASGAGVVIAWRTSSSQGYSLSRATYVGAYRDDALFFSGEVTADLFDDRPITLSLLPASATLSEIKVDKQPAPIVLEQPTGEEPRFATRVQGKGTHTITLEFTIPVDKEQSPLTATFAVPRVPISRFNLTFPGKQQLTVEPSASIVRKEEKDTTLASVFIPMTDSVTLSWVDAVPEETKEEARVTVSVYHTASAEEGVLSARAIAVAEISRGKTNLLEFEIPKGIQVDRVTTKGQTVADWRVSKDGPEGRDILQVYFDRAIDGEATVEIGYDTSLPPKDRPQQITVPLLRPHNVQRERGMVALLATKELTFSSAGDSDLTRVGENQIPPFIRETIDKTVALSYKYSESLPVLQVNLTKPDRQQGRFDASVNTLISLGDVAIRGSASVDISVKSGTIGTLQLELPPGVNFLNLSAPSLRNQQLHPDGEKQVIDVEFTQDMEGQFRIEVAYERILPDKEQTAGVPTILVRGAEIEQGRIAIEALSAVEILPGQVDHLSTVDPADLPQQLVMKTTNPILLAYKYAHVSPPYTLELRITRHKELDVQHAVIEEASYHTLFTRDGVSVTRALYQVRNSREQFLRITLPPESKVWQVFVGGRPEKPALAESATQQGKSGPTVLIRIMNSAQGFPVDILYQTPISALSFAGRIGSALPSPDMIVTSSKWNVYLPSDLAYGRLTTTMTPGVQGISVQQYQMAQSLQRGRTEGRGEAASTEDQPLPFSLPSTGVQYSFERLYANQGTAEASWSLWYFSWSAQMILQALALLALAFGARAATRYSKTRSAQARTIAVVSLLVVVGIHLGFGLPYRISVLAAGAAVASLVFSRLRLWYSQRRPQPPAEAAPEAV